MDKKVQQTSCTINDDAKLQNDWNFTDCQEPTDFLHRVHDEATSEWSSSSTRPTGEVTKVKFTSNHHITGMRPIFLQQRVKTVAIRNFRNGLCEGSDDWSATCIFTHERISGWINSQPLGGRAERYLFLHGRVTPRNCFTNTKRHRLYQDS